MAISATDRNESLQCIACALRQAVGRDINEFELVNAVMDWKRNSLDHKVRDAIGITPEMETFVTNWVDTEHVEKEKKGQKPSADFDQWIRSSILVANELAKSPDLDSSGYIFYRQDFFPLFKNKAFEFAQNIKNSTTNPYIKQAYSASASSGGWKDKWNPSDILAIKANKVRNVEDTIKNFDPSKHSKGSEELREQNLKFQQLFRSGQKSKQLAVIYAMDSLYEYNKVINQLCDDKECVGISLKLQVNSSSVPIKKFQFKDVKGLEQALDLSITIDEIHWKPDAAKAVIDFTVGEGQVKDDQWNLDARGTESGSAKPTLNLKGKGGLADIQLNLMNYKSSTAHGKASLSVLDFITRQSGGSAAIRAQQAKKREIFGDRKVPVSSGTYLTDSMVFESYMDYRIGNRTGYKEFSGLWRNDLPLWVGYIDWLSGSKVQGRKIIKAVRDAARFTDEKASDYTFEVGKGKSKKKRTKEEWARMKIFPQQKQLRGDVKINWTKLRQAIKYLKNKVQAYEVANIFDHDNGTIKKEIKENIMKGVYSYAASKGLRIFTEKKVVDYMTSSNYIKVGGLK